MSGFLFLSIRSYSNIIRVSPITAPISLKKSTSLALPIDGLKSTMTFERSAPSSVFSKKFDWRQVTNSAIGVGRGVSGRSKLGLPQIKLLFKKTNKSSLTMSRGPMANKKFSKIQFGFVRQRAVVSLAGQLSIPTP